MNHPWWAFNDWSYKTRRGTPCSPQEQEVTKETLRKRQALAESRRRKHDFFTAVTNKDHDAALAMLRRIPSLIGRHTRTGATPLMLAAAVNDPVMVATLLEQGADVLAQDGIGATALILAAATGATEVVHLLLNSKQGGNAGRTYLLSQTTKGGETCVMAAAKGGHTDTLAALLKHGAPHTAVTLQGASALMLACRHDRVECARTLLHDGKLRATDVDRQGRTAAMYAARHGAVQALQLQLDLQPPLDLTQPDLEGVTVLGHACEGGHVACAELLVKRGARFEGPGNAPGNTLYLHIAAKAGKSDMITWLLSQGVGVDSLTSQGSANPIFTAVRSGSAAAVDALLKAGVRVEVRDDRGRTPLAVAAAHGFNGPVRLLVKNGADLLALDRTGRVPRQLATRHHHQDTAQLLSDLARDRLLVEDSQLDKEAAEVGALLVLPRSSKLWLPHSRSAHDPTTVSTYQLV